jgi:hypothetical protein
MLNLRTISGMQIELDCAKMIERTFEEVAVNEMLADRGAPYAEAVTVLADALDRLGARIHRDLNVETGEAAPASDPELAATLVSFSAYADECLEALDDVRVLAALMAAKRATSQPSGPAAAH